MSDPTIHHHSFPSMGSEIEVLLMGDDEVRAREAFQQAEAIADEWMRTFSRFDPESELSRLNASSGDTVVVSGRLFDAISAAIGAYELTGGLFNPLVLPALIAHGYDRTIESLEHGEPVTMAPPIPPGAGEIVMDAGRSWVRLPAGSALDLGGIAKGLYADELAAQLADWPGGIVSAGGDVRAWGTGPDDGGWAVGVEDPGFGADDVAVVVLRDGAIATSGTNRRRWRRGEETMHHLIDPRRGRPASTSDRTVTVLAPTGVQAEIGATACFIDPECSECDGLPRNLWALIDTGLNRMVSFVEFDPEAPIDVYFNQ